MMKFALYTIACSPHQVPLAKAMIDVYGDDEYRYVAVRPPIRERRSIGWGGAGQFKWLVTEQSDKDAARDILENAEVLMCGIRDLQLMESRCANGLLTIYSSERWFKPRMGILRLLCPSYLKMACRFVRLLRKNDMMYCFPIGVHAARDIARLCGLFAGDLRCLFRAPELEFEQKPGGRIWIRGGVGSGGVEEWNRRYCLDKMRMWGYFVEPSKFAARSQPKTPNSIRFLWVGRLLKLKCIDTIIRAVGALSRVEKFHSPTLTSNSNSLKISLDIYGTGPEEVRLKKLAAKYGDIIKFYPPVPIDEVRKLMQEYDVYVFGSNAYEGWGAVVSEALEEGMKVIGTYEAGSSATILPESCLFHAGASRDLLRMLQLEVPRLESSLWSAQHAADSIRKFIGEVA